MTDYETLKKEYDMMPKKLYEIERELAIAEANLSTVSQDGLECCSLSEGWIERKTIYGTARTQYDSAEMLLPEIRRRLETAAAKSASHPWTISSQVVSTLKNKLHSANAHKEALYHRLISLNNKKWLDDVKKECNQFDSGQDNFKVRILDAKETIRSFDDEERTAQEQVDAALKLLWEEEEAIKQRRREFLERISEERRSREIRKADAVSHLENLQKGDNKSPSKGNVDNLRRILEGASVSCIVPNELASVKNIYTSEVYHPISKWIEMAESEAERLEKVAMTT